MTYTRHIPSIYSTQYNFQDWVLHPTMDGWKEGKWKGGTEEGRGGGPGGGGEKGGGEGLRDKQDWVLHHTMDGWREGG
jgi:hypothetical protein